MGEVVKTFFFFGSFWAFVLEARRPEVDSLRHKSARKEREKTNWIVLTTCAYGFPSAARRFAKKAGGRETAKKKNQKGRGVKNVAITPKDSVSEH